jgi:vacuolar-type H+-ATPase subunit F/Vma7
MVERAHQNHVDSFDIPFLSFWLLLDTPLSLVEETFNRLTERDDIGIVLINQHVRKWASF